MSRDVLIERVAMTCADERPLPTSRGCQRVDQAVPLPDRNATAQATYVPSLEQACLLIKRGNAIAMARPACQDP